MKGTRAKDVQEFFERVATDWDTMRLARSEARMIPRKSYGGDSTSPSGFATV